MKSVFKDELVIDGVAYVHGPEIPLGQDHCEACAAKDSEDLCGKLGFSCVHSYRVYWVRKPDVPASPASPASPAVAEDTPKYTVCPKCGDRHMTSLFVNVHHPDGTVTAWCYDCARKHADICELCGKTHLRGHLTAVSGSGNWCQSCVATHTKRCGKCGNAAPSHAFQRVKRFDSATGAYIEEDWCGCCALSHSRTCTCCNTRVSNDSASMLSIGNELLCHVCSDERVVTCQDCGTRTAVSDVVYRNGMFICRRCRDRAASSCGVRGYHGFPSEKMRFYRVGADGTEVVETSQASDALYLGFELEAGGVSQEEMSDAAADVLGMPSNRSERRFHLERDGSIPAYGFEVVSQPHTYESHCKYEWNEMLKFMIGHGMKSHDLRGECGLHIHVSRTFLSAGDCANIDLFVLKNKTFWERIARRTQSSYAKYVNKPTSEAGISRERYCAVNFLNSRTVEFRLFRGTLKYDTLLATLGIVDGLCKWIKTRTTDQILSNKKEIDNFVDWLTSQGTKYERSVAYIATRRAVDDANAGASDT